jgi:predicted nuclease of restriction endonuclease-like (RecB) superfamily
MKKKNDAIKLKSSAPTTKEYTATLVALKKQIREAQIKAALAANKELIMLYWQIGKTIAEKQKESGWGSSVIERLANDLQKEFPGIGGFSRRNIFRMQAFYLAYQEMPQLVAQFERLSIFNIPWGHNAIILEKLKDTRERLWYAQKTIENGWSRAILGIQIESNLLARTGKAVTNFKKTIPTPDSDLAQQSLKDPYVFDFLTLREDHVEQDIEQGLIDNVQKLLLELGKGFSFVGRQYHMQVGTQDFYLDLLFYHFKLRCFVVVELKSGQFDPRDAGQLNFYLSAVDSNLKGPEDKPTIGLLLCKSKDNLVAEYALRDINKPIGVAGYETALIAKLPKNLKSSLPTIEEIEAELEKSEITEIKSKKTKKK